MLYLRGEKMSLNIRQEKFCLEYAKTGNATQSAIEAGYSENTARITASKLLSKVNIKNRIEELAGEYKTEKIADIQEMQEALTAIIRQEMTEEVLMMVNQGEYGDVQACNKKPAIRDVINAINTLAKMQGGFNERVTLDINPIVIKDDLSETD